MGPTRALSELENWRSQSSDCDRDRTYAKIAWRIIPLLGLLFLMAWLDRYNLGFARLQMTKDLGFSNAVYGFGAGIVYLGYALFEIPSNLLLERIGARKTFTRITVLWGLTSIATMFVRTPAQFYSLRFLLGSFEAGLFPGALVYLNSWFPSGKRAQMVALFCTAVPISTILGGPISGWIMESMGGRGGLANWQWLFVVEGVPSVAIGILVLLFLVDNPAEANWLTEGERRLVMTDLEEDALRAGVREHRFFESLRLSKVWLLAAIRFCAVSANMTIGFWVPALIRDFGVKSAIAIGMLSTLPYIVSVVGIVWVGRHSDRTGECRYHAAIPCLASGLGLIGIGQFTGSPALAFGCLILAVGGPMIHNGPFWQIPPLLLVGRAAAVGIALINTIGSLSGWVGPSLVGWLEDITGTPTTGLYVVAGLEILAAIMMLVFVPRPNGEKYQAATSSVEVANR